MWKKLLAHGLSTLPIKVNPVFNNGPKGLLKNPSVCAILCNWVFDNVILADEPIAKSSQNLEICILPNSNLCQNTNNIWKKIQSYFRTIFYSRL